VFYKAMHKSPKKSVGIMNSPFGWMRAKMRSALFYISGTSN
jgi:hypothetical protein